MSREEDLARVRVCYHPPYAMYQETETGDWYCRHCGKKLEKKEPEDKNEKKDGQD